MGRVGQIRPDRFSNNCGFRLVEADRRLHSVQLQPQEGPDRHLNVVVLRLGALALRFFGSAESLGLAAVSVAGA